MTGHATVGERIRAARANTTHTQLSLALAAGVSPQTIWRYEHGETVPDAETVQRIAHVLGVSTASLLGEAA